MVRSRIAILCFMLLIACTSTKEDEVSPQMDNNPNEMLVVSYNAHIKPIIEKNCKVCHSDASPGAGLDLTSYEVLAQVAGSGKLYGVISHAPGFPKMPKGQEQLSDDDIKKIKTWIDAGTKND